MLIRLRNTGNVVGDAEFRILHANTSFPAMLTEEILDNFGADQVFAGADPQPTNQYQIVVEHGVEEISGKWYTKKILGPVFADVTSPTGVVITAAEQEAEYRSTMDVDRAKEVRANRNKLISECDWTQIDDAPLTNDEKAAWVAYRQLLRDVPQQASFPWSVQWPVKPG